MPTTTRSLPETPAADALGGNAGDRAGHARAFGNGGSPPTVQIQARLRYRGDRQRASLVTSGIPRPRAVQILDAVLRLPALRDAGVEPSQLRVDLHRADAGRWEHHYGLALGVAMVSSLANAAVPANVVLLGDLDLHGNVCEVQPRVVDAVNDAIDAYRIETPLTAVLAPDGAAWVRSSPVVRVAACRTLADAVAATWPRMCLRSPR